MRLKYENTVRCLDLVSCRCWQYCCLDIVCPSQKYRLVDTARGPPCAPAVSSGRLNSGENMLHSVLCCGRNSSGQISQHRQSYIPAGFTIHNKNVHRHVHPITYSVLQTPGLQHHQQQRQHGQHGQQQAKPHRRCSHPPSCCTPSHAVSPYHTQRIHVHVTHRLYSSTWNHNTTGYSGTVSNPS